MNVLRSTFMLPRVIGCSTPSVTVLSRAVSGWVLSGPPRPGGVLRAGAGSQGQPWLQQQVRSVKRGTEYQPKNIKRIRTHGWATRISSRGGIEVLLRRMLKGRRSLTVYGGAHGHSARD
ncbi:39S ribosomal protein L34, mitochondrial [Conger conger]|uniref:39S ribosomal protein L34, mitochondrial n=1 Tax=Conger conger TaxID=82655 RepID=UPI002A5A713F|nr:39S ribosomal protein L34, mitochondrial [Conger conger]